MKNWRQHAIKCIGDRPEVEYKSMFNLSPEPRIAIMISEIMHDTGMSARALIDMCLDYAFSHITLEPKRIMEVKFDDDEQQG